MEKTERESGRYEIRIEPYPATDFGCIGGVVVLIALVVLFIGVTWWAWATIALWQLIAVGIVVPLCFVSAIFVTKEGLAWHREKRESWEKRWGKHPMADDARRGRIMTAPPIAKTPTIEDERKPSSTSLTVVSTSTPTSPLAVEATHVHPGKNFIAVRAAYKETMSSAAGIRTAAICMSAMLTVVTFIANPCFGVATLLVLGGASVGVWSLVDRFMITAPSKAFCPHCGKYLPSDLSWVCGRCGIHHENDNKHSFLNCCKQCGHAPTAYQCHHPDCEEIIYLDRSYDATFCAYGVGRPEPSMNEQRRRQEQIAEAEDHNKMLSIHVDTAGKLIQLNERITALTESEKPKKRLAKRAEKSPLEKIEEDWQSHERSLHDLQTFISKSRAEAKRRHARDPVGLQEAEDRIDQFYEKWLQKFERGEL